MGSYSFLKDLEESKVAVNIVKTYVKDLHKEEVNLIINDLERARQAEGDIEVLFRKKKSYTIEVKYDMMAKKTGNVCFETHNKKGTLTGISSTKADEVHYVIPDEEGFTLYMFKTEALKKYLFDEKNVSKFKSVKGGDRRATFMLLVKRELLEEDKVAYKVEKINA